MDVSSDLADILQRGRDTVGRGAWPDAYDLLTEVDARTTLSPEDLELLAKASWWTGHQNASIDARERGYEAYLERGDKERAAFMALTLRREHSAKLAGSVAMGWLNRAERLLEDEPESLSHGYLALAHGSLAWSRGELDHALSHMERGLKIGEKFENRDLQALAAMYRGMVLDEPREERQWSDSSVAAGSRRSRSGRCSWRPPARTRATRRSAAAGASRLGS